MYLRRLLLPSSRSSRVFWANPCSCPLRGGSRIRSPLRLSRLPGTMMGVQRNTRCYLLCLLDLNSMAVVRENLCDEFGREALTVVAKSPQTVPNVGIQRIGLDVGMFLDASLSSRSKADRSALASLRLCLNIWSVASSMAHECAGGKNSEVHSCLHGCYTYDKPLTKRPPAMKSAAHQLSLADVLGISPFYSVNGWVEAAMVRP